MTAMQFQPAHRHLLKSLGAWITELVEDYPDYDEYDFAELLEERTGLMVGPDDFEAIRALYLRAKLQEYRPDEDGGE